MSIVSYIIIALAFGTINMLLMQRCGKATPVRLTAGLGVVVAVAAVHVALMIVGHACGSLLMFQNPDDPERYADVNSYIFLGLVLAVVLKSLVPYLRREPALAVFDLGKGSAVAGMAVASGVNVFLVGVGTGFVEHAYSVHKLIWPLLVASVVLGYVGLMFGRQRVAMRPRRWMMVAAVLLLGVAVAAVVNA